METQPSCFRAVPGLSLRRCANCYEYQHGPGKGAVIYYCCSLVRSNIPNPQSAILKPKKIRFRPIKVGKIRSQLNFQSQINSGTLSITSAIPVMILRLLLAGFSSREPANAGFRTMAAGSLAFPELS